MRRTSARIAVLGCVLAVATGCSSSSGSAGPSSSSGSPTAAPPSVTSSGSPSSVATSDVPAATTPAFDGVSLAIAVDGRSVTPEPSRHPVKAGQKVRLTVTSDQDNVVHIHGVDIERDVRAGVPLTVTFTANDSGVYPIEMHEPELLLAQLVVR